MKEIITVCALLIHVFLATCGNSEIPVQIPEASPSETTFAQTETAPVAITDFTEYYNLLESETEEKNWIYYSMGCLFTEPEEIPLNYLFYLGVDYYGSWNEISAKSQQHLLDQGFWHEMDIQIMPVKTLESIVHQTFGLSLSEMTIPEEWEFIETENAYCSNHNDAYFPSSFTITNVIEYNDGIVEILYTVDMFYDGTTGEFYDAPSLMLTLQKTSENNWHVLSNILVFD